MDFTLKGCSETISIVPALTLEQKKALPYHHCTTKDRTEYRRHKRCREAYGTHLDTKTSRGVWVFSTQIAISGAVSVAHMAVIRDEAKEIVQRICGPGLVFGDPVWTLFLSRAEAPRPPAEVFELTLPLIAGGRGNFGGTFQFNPSVKILTFTGNNLIMVFTSKQPKEFHDECCAAIGRMFTGLKNI